MTTVVLGWDALDHELAGQFGLREAFGPHSRAIDTFENPILGEPHTMELWPSIVTGRRPEHHGVWAKESEDRKEWDHPLVDRASELSRGVVPKRLRTRIGRLLTRAGAEGTSQVTRAYYEDGGVDTVFDGRRSRAISVPNYQTPLDDRHGFDIDRAGVFERIPDGGDGDGARYELQDPPHVVDELLGRIAAARIGVVNECLQYDYDLVFVWLGYLDTVGHLAPVVDEGGWQRRCYVNAARMTEAVRSTMIEGDQLVCVSDHGLQGGKHTDSPYLGASDERVLEGVESVLDVRDGVERVTPRTDDGGPPTVREPFRRDGTVESESAEEVRSRLEDLGYI